MLDYVTSFYEGRNTEAGNSYNFFADEDLIEFIDSIHRAIAAHLGREG